MKSSIRTIVYVIAISALTVFSTAMAAGFAHADVLQKDIQVVLRTLGFLQTPPSGEVNLAILYDPAISSSVTEARQLEEILKNGMKGKNITLFAKSIPVSSLGELNKNDFVFVTGKMKNHYSKIAEKTRSQNILSFSMDRGCVDQGYCTVYFNTDGRVEIIVNNTAATAAKIEFNPVFLMMVTVL